MQERHAEKIIGAKWGVYKEKYFSRYKIAKKKKKQKWSRKRFSEAKPLSLTKKDHRRGLNEK